MKVFLTSAYDDFVPSTWLKAKSPISDTICTNDPDEADVIIFVEGHPEDNYFRKILANPLYLKYKRKSVLYHDTDLSVTALPTLSPSIEKWQYNKKHKGVAHYIARICENEAIEKGNIDYDTNRAYLYSFLGARTHEVRNEILSLKHDSNTYIKDTTGLHAWDMNPRQKLEYEKLYYDVLNKSSFVLAPRGIGPCSYRLFESMQVGRSPVIIADAWPKIDDIHWDEFSITIPESEIKFIKEILEERKGDAIEMGKKARLCWEENFSPEVSLQTISNAAMKLVKHRYSFIDSIKDHAGFLRRPSHFIQLLRSKKKEYQKRFGNK